MRGLCGVDKLRGDSNREVRGWGNPRQLAGLRTHGKVEGVSDEKSY